MPNWCANSLRITAETPEAAAMLATIRAELSKEQPAIFQTIDPCPAALQDTRAGFPPDEREKANRAAYGFSNWYEFQHARWGTKWDAAEVETLQDSGNALTLQFNTAWAPPVGIYETLRAAGFDVQATFIEQGCAFIGFWENGHDHTEDLQPLEEDADEYRFLKDFFAQFEIDHHPAHFGG